MRNKPIVPYDYNDCLKKCAKRHCHSSVFAEVHEIVGKLKIKKAYALIMVTDLLNVIFRFGLF
jgi:hypothetical protein